jgi:hypothetical protein
MAVTARIIRICNALKKIAIYDEKKLPKRKRSKVNASEILKTT